MLNVFLEYWNAIEQLLGFSPLLMLPVFVIVSLVDRVTNLKERLPEWRNHILGVMCLLAGALVTVTTEYETWREIVTGAMYLGSLSSLSYQIFKGLYRGLRHWIETKAKDKFDLDVTIEE